jgi:transaldolase
MQLFVDSANLRDIDAALKRGIASGVTTNPSILSHEEPRDFTRHIRDVIELLRSYGGPIPLSVELNTSEPTQMARQARLFLDQFGDYDELYIKVPIGWDELQVMHEIRLAGGRVNCTCCMSYNQALLAANAGAHFISLFWGRIRDIGYDAASVVRSVRQTFKERDCKSRIIVGSIRQMIDVNEAVQAGADIVTVPPKLLPLLCQHPKTDEAVKQFLRDFGSWSGNSVPPDYVAGARAQST